jgi:hypothetical protein
MPSHQLSSERPHHSRLPTAKSAPHHIASIITTAQHQRLPARAPSPKISPVKKIDLEQLIEQNLKMQKRRRASTSLKIWGAQNCWCIAKSNWRAL